MNNIRFGLCCIFIDYPIRFRIKQAAYITKFDRKKQLAMLSETVVDNCTALMEAVQACHKDKIGCFRLNSRFFPLKTHPLVKYALDDLPGYEIIVHSLEEVRRFCEKKDIRLTFHPDQFILLSSPKKDVVKNSIADLIYHNELAKIIGADVINIHAGGGYGDKNLAMSRLKKTITELPQSLRNRLTIENDDRIFSPNDLIPLCHDLGLPFVYDVHHHRCLPDSLSETEATKLALQTWNREPLFHLSSPKNRWEGGNPRPHSDFIDPNDFPTFWRDLSLTVEIEAKNKERAIKQLRTDLGMK